MVAPPPSPLASVATPLPEGWKAHWNPQYNAWYYENIYTEASVWEKPTQAVYLLQKVAAVPPGPPPPGYQHVAQSSHDSTASLNASMSSMSTSNKNSSTHHPQHASVQPRSQETDNHTHSPQLYDGRPRENYNYPIPAPVQHVSSVLRPGSLASHQRSPNGLPSAGQPAQYFANTPQTVQVRLNDPSHVDAPPGFDRNQPSPSLGLQSLQHSVQLPTPTSIQGQSPPAKPSGLQLHSSSVRTPQGTTHSRTQCAPLPPKSQSRDSNAPSVVTRPNFTQIGSYSSVAQPSYEANLAQRTAYESPQQLDLQNQNRPSHSLHTVPSQPHQNSQSTQQQAPPTKIGFMGMFHNKVGSKIAGGSAGTLLEAGAGLIGGAFLKRQRDEHEEDERRMQQAQQQQQQQQHYQQPSQVGAMTATDGLTGMAGGAGLASFEGIQCFSGGSSAVEIPVTEPSVVDDSSYVQNAVFVEDSTIVDSDSYIRNNSFVKNDTPADNSSYAQNNAFVDNTTMINNSSYIQNTALVEYDVFVDNSIDIQNNTFVEDDTFVDDSTYVQNETLVDNSSYIQNEAFLGNDTFVDNSSYAQNDTFIDNISYTQDDTLIDNSNCAQDDASVENVVFLENDTYAIP